MIETPGDLPCVQQASYLEGGPLLWKLHLYLHVNQKSNTDDDDDLFFRYFVHGSCNKGKDCPFSHNRSDKMDNVCRYYLKGCCSYADGCR